MCDVGQSDEDGDHVYEKSDIQEVGSTQPRDDHLPAYEQLSQEILSKEIFRGPHFSNTIELFEHNGQLLASTAVAESFRCYSCGVDALTNTTVLCPSLGIPPPQIEGFLSPAHDAISQGEALYITSYRLPRPLDPEHTLKKVEP